MFGGDTLPDHEVRKPEADSVMFHCFPSDGVWSVLTDKRSVWHDFLLLRNRAAVVPAECFCWNDWCHGTRLRYRGSEESGEAQLVL